MKNENNAIKKLTSEKSKVSSHYFIKNNGEILSLVPDIYTAWHAVFHLGINTTLLISTL